MMTEKEFNHTILPLTKNIYSFALSFIGNAADSADITQEVMCRLWDSRTRLKEVANPKAWALKMTRNLCLDFLKKHKPLYNEEEMFRHELYETDPFQILEQKNTAEAVQEIMQHLPVTQREVVQLREIEELEFEEIAHITGLGLNNIRVILSRARSRIKEILIKKYQISPYD